MLEKPRLKRASSEENKSIEERVAIRRAELMEKFPSQEEGIDAKCIKGFFRDHGLRSVDVTFLPGEAKKNFQETLGEETADIFNDTRCGGVYLNELDLAVVMRNKELENTNGPFIFERFGVHEASHGTNAHRGFNMYNEQDESDVSLPRLGFAVRGTESVQGHFLEEAFASYMESKYVALYIPEDSWKRIEDQVKRELSTNESVTKDRFVQNKSSHGTTHIPVKYLYLNARGTLTTSIAGFAGAGINMIKEKHPEIESVLIGARNSPDGLRILAKMIDDISPGLYITLQRLKYTEEDFTRGNALIAKAIDFDPNKQASSRT